MATYEIYQGDTGPVFLPRPSVLDPATVLDADWSCWVAVNDLDGNVAITKYEITEKTVDDLRWVAVLTPNQTGTLSVNTDGTPKIYTMIIEVKNSVYSPVFNVEKHFTLGVKPQGIPA